MGLHFGLDLDPALISASGIGILDLSAAVEDEAKAAEASAASAPVTPIAGSAMARVLAALDDEAAAAPESHRTGSSSAGRSIMSAASARQVELLRQAATPPADAAGSPAPLVLASAEERKGEREVGPAVSGDRSGIVAGALAAAAPASPEALPDVGTAIGVSAAAATSSISLHASAAPAGQARRSNGEPKDGQGDRQVVSQRGWRCCGC